MNWLVESWLDKTPCLGEKTANWGCIYTLIPASRKGQALPLVPESREGGCLKLNCWLSNPCTSVRESTGSHDISKVDAMRGSCAVS